MCLYVRMYVCAFVRRGLCNAHSLKCWPFYLLQQHGDCVVIVVITLIPLPSHWAKTQVKPVNW